MLQRWLVSVFVPLGLAAMVSSLAAAPQAQLNTYQKPNGETYFALSLKPELTAARAPSDVLVLFDTSASQAGVYRDDALSALGTLLEGLTPADRVQLVAVDVKAVPMSEGFVEPNSTKMLRAMEKLKQRAPLGSTDLVNALRAAGASFADASRAHTIIYIGDGESRAHMLNHEDFSSVLKELVAKRAAVSSVAIGPKRDNELLATLANQTGGLLFIDSAAEGSALRAGRAMVQAVNGTVAWPTQTFVSADMKEAFPAAMPPLRSDRDTILVGVLAKTAPQEIKLTAEVQGKPVSLSFKAEPAKSSDDFSFLPRVVERARTDGGLSLPTVGTAGLNEVRRVVQSGAQEVADLAGRALASGDARSAQKLAQAALQQNPAEVQAALVEKTATKAKAGEPALRLVNLQNDLDPLAAGAAPKAQGAAAGSLLSEVEAEGGTYLQSVEQLRRVREQELKNDVEIGLTQARNIMASNPQGAGQQLKVLLETVERAPELSADVRVQLRDQIETAIRESNRRRIEQENRNQIVIENAAAGAAQQKIIEGLDRDQEKVKQLMDRFNALMKEQRYVEAEMQVAPQVKELMPDSPIAVSAHDFAAYMRNFSNIMDVRERRWRGFADTMFEVEKSLVPFPDEPPVVYPAAPVWEELSIRRKKYASIDLAKRGGAEEKILNALNDTTSLEFIETPLKDVADFLKDLHGIPIVLDKKAIEAVGASPDTPVTQNLKGISLRSALRLLLQPMDLTYVVRDEVLYITTPEEAGSKLITKVYPVADLVLPVQSSAGANPFSLGGNIGGQGGFGGGLGQGGGNGLFGNQGGGNNNGGNGGFFAVEEKLTLGGKKETPATAPVAAEPKVQRPAAATSAPAVPLDVKVSQGQSVADAWDAFFKQHAKDNDTQRAAQRAGVRQAVRELMDAKRFDDVSAVIQSALRNGQPQPWMYEALGLSLQARQLPLDQIADELERAVMSAVDFSESGDETMYVAKYLAHIGLDRRAIKLYQDLAKSNPSRPEPYVQALTSAQKIDDLAAIEWACAGILRQAWPKDQAEIEANAQRVAKATLERLQTEKRIDEAKNFAALLDGARVRDCIVRVSWTGDADIDLVIEEPSGTVCSFRCPRTTSGGVILGDSFSRPAANGVAQTYSETYVCPEGFSGDYRVLVRRVFGKVTAGTVTVDIFTHYGTKDQKQIHKQIPLGEKDALLVFDVKQGRRQEALEEAQVAQAAKLQAEISRAVVTQQLNALAQQNTVSATLEKDRASQLANNRNGRGRGAVGFRPVITTLPEGTNMTATAVISADRRYVRITAIPLFSFIGDVSTFNFVSGQVGDGNPPDNNDPNNNNNNNNNN